MDIKQIVNQINYLDEQVKAMLLIEDRATRMQYLENMKLSVDILKAWAGKPSNERGALPIPDVSKSVYCKCRPHGRFNSVGVCVLCKKEYHP
jgi:hypothetical protein